MYYNMIVKTLYGLLIKICKSVNIQINKNIQELEVRIKTPYFPVRKNPKSGRTRGTATTTTTGRIALKLAWRGGTAENARGSETAGLLIKRSGLRKDKGRETYQTRPYQQTATETKPKPDFDE